MGKTEWIHTYLKIPEEKLSKMQRFLKGKGSLFGFFVFIPVIGDIMIVALGLLRANPLGTLLSMMVGKFSRYYLVVIGINYLKEWFPKVAENTQPQESYPAIKRSPSTASELKGIMLPARNAAMKRPKYPHSLRPAINSIRTILCKGLI